MQAVTDVTKRPVSFFRIVPAFIFFNDSLLPIKRFDEGEIHAVIGQVFCPLRLVPFIHPCLIVPPNKSVVQCGESGRPAVAAFDSGNLLAVANALREQHKGKVIVIAGDDDHRLETNPGRTKLEPEKNARWSRWFNLSQRMSQGSVTVSESRIQTVQG